MTMPSPRVGVVLVEALIGSGVRDVVLAPGSRSAPLALALADAERRGLLRLHVRIDERSAAYLALGISRSSGDPVVVVTTSGTAAVNLHPAIVEAAYSGIPLIAITADRPGSVRGSGANQTIDQRDLFGVDAVASVDLEGLDEADLRRTVIDAVAVAADSLAPGPIQLNCPLAEPLVVAGGHVVSSGGHGVAPAVAPPRADAPRGIELDLADMLPAGVDMRHGVLVVGDFDDHAAREAAGALATSLGWPVISEPSGNLASHPHALRHGPLILAGDFAQSRTPDVVVTIGRVGLHRSVMSMLKSARAHVAVDVPPRLGRVDPARSALAIVPKVPVAGAVSPDVDWLPQWRAVDDGAADIVQGRMTGDAFVGPVVASIVAEHAGADDLLVIGPSWPVRHVSAYAGPLRARCIGNRGTSGIDGVMSTAWGAALGHGERHPRGTTYALVGDLTAIYDRNGLLAPAGETRPRLDYVVVDNDGGGIFSSLEQGADDFAQDFERVFGTAHGGDLVALLAAPGIPVLAVSDADGLRRALAEPADGVRVIVARCASRDREASFVRELQAAIG